MAIPQVTPEAVRDALSAFDEQFRNQPDWDSWEDRESHKYAISYEGRLYPVKRIVSLAAGIPVSQFNGGEEANSYVESKGFKVVPLASIRVGVKVRLTVADCELFKRHPTRRPWAEIPPADQSAYKDI